MFRSRVKKRYRKGRNSRYYQGDILQDLVFVVGDASRESDKDLIELKYAVILTQDCDLKQDYNYRKSKTKPDQYLRSLLVCPAYDLEEFASGNHFQGWKLEVYNSKKIEKLKNNNEYKRFHYLPNDASFFVPELVLDFKHYFTLPRDYIYKRKVTAYLSSLSELFREELTQRFSNYISRIGLPDF